MAAAERTMTASHFKPRCLRLLDEVARTRQPIVITKRDQPIAKLIPVETGTPDERFGCLARLGWRLMGDVTKPMEPVEAWETLTEWDALNALRPGRKKRAR
jgi:prevent-host-death family protein